MDGFLHVKTLTTWLVLCICGILGKGTLRMNPFSRVPTNPVWILWGMSFQIGSLPVDPSFQWTDSLMARALPESGHLVMCEQVSLNCL
jgi:hypothetical protein